MNQANKTKINELMSKWVNYGLIIITPPLPLKPNFMSNISKNIGPSNKA